jgi:hypothetical protein
MAINSRTNSVDINPFISKNIIEDAIELEKKRARRIGSKADPEKHFNAERIAPLVRALALAGTGGAVGYNMSGGNIPKPFGAYIGALAGAGSSALISLASQIAAMLTKRRKKDDQIKADEKGVLSKYIIPGLAEYDGAKRYESAKYDTYEKKGSEKSAQQIGAKGIWDSVMERINAAKAWYDKPENAALRPLVNAGIGAVGLGALNKLLGGSFGRGAVLGGIGGAATGVDWNALSNALGTKAKENAQAKADSKSKPE